MSNEHYLGAIVKQAMSIHVTCHPFVTYSSPQQGELRSNTLTLASLSQPHFGLSVKVKSTLPKVGSWSPPRFLKNSERDCRGQISSHSSVLGVIGKVLKCRCPKWSRMGHLDICSSSYGQKKGRESNWQFDSRPLKVGNRPVPDVRSRSVTWRWKALFEGYNFDLDLVPIKGRGEELWSPKVPGL
jgi:hypothetical protein